VVHAWRPQGTLTEGTLRATDMGVAPGHDRAPVRRLAAAREEDRFCPDIITQIASAQEALRAVGRQLLRNHLKHCATAAIKQGPQEADATYDELLELVYRHLRSGQIVWTGVVG